jgi:hypothetical protein
MNIVEKQDGCVHARACADGSKEQLEPDYKKEDGTSPTVATDSILISATIDAHKGCDVPTINISGAFLNAYNNKETIMLLKGCLTKLMVQVNPQLYCKYIIHDSKNQPLLYVKLMKLIYGLLKSALLFYQKFVDNLKSYSLPFIINPYNSCVANATVTGSKMMVTWHIDDLKTSHIDPFQVTKFAAYLATIYGNGLVVHCGLIHDFLGMDLNFSQPGIAQISMINYTKKVLEDFPKAITTSFATPAANHLFTVQDKKEAKILPKEQAQAFHHTVAQLLFLCKHTGRDIQTAVSFLTTRVKCPDKDEWGKLKQALRYLCGTCQMKLNLSADNLTTIRWWVDASHVVNDNCRGHTGAMMSLGKGADISFSNKQKINTKSSTESELVGANQALSSIIHTQHFIEVQGYSVEQNCLFKDQSTMHLEVNVSFSSSKRTKHIKC